MGRAVVPKEKHKVGKLTDMMRAFAHEYVVDWCGKDAAIRAGYKLSDAKQRAADLLNHPEVQKIIQQKMKQVETKTGISAERALAEAWGVATADVNELVEFRRVCCRHCYGKDFDYQRTHIEMKKDRALYERDRLKAIAKDPNCAATYEPFDEAGGIGYDARKAPNPDCINCWGDGVGTAHFKDTRTLSPQARALYAGVKQTRDGYQMLTIDKLAGLEKVFKHLGLYKVDNEQKGGEFKAFMDMIAAKGGGKLPIKDGQ